MAKIVTTVEWTEDELRVLAALNRLRDAQLALNEAGQDEWGHLAIEDAGPYGEVGKVIRSVLAELLVEAVPFSFDRDPGLLDRVLDTACETGEPISWALSCALQDR